MEKPKPKKQRIWLYVDTEILSWVYEKMKNKVYADESHCFEKLVIDEINREKDMSNKKIEANKQIQENEETKIQEKSLTKIKNSKEKKRF